MTNETHMLLDQEILIRSITEPKLFEILVERYQKAFLRKAKSIVRSPDVAEDVVQDTFLKIYKYAAHFKEEPQASFKSWAYKILLNTCYTYYMRQKRERERFTYADFGDIDSLAAPTSEVSRDVSFIESMLGRMPSRLAHIVKLYFLEGKSQEEIAESEEISRGAVRARIHRARKYFKELTLKTV